MDKTARKNHIKTIMEALQQVGDYATSDHTKDCQCNICRQHKKGMKSARALLKEVSPTGGDIGNPKPPKVQIYHG